MRRTSIAAVGFLVALGCATQKAEQVPAPEQPPRPTTESFHVTNVSTFDLGNCFPLPVELPKPATAETLSGLLAAARPQLDECLVDPKNRGPANETSVEVEVAVTDKGVTYDASGANLTPEGKACLESALQSRAHLEAAPAGTPPVSAKAKLVHVVGVNPSVTFGTNEINDAIGQIRLQLPTWCECFEPWKSSAPHTLTGELELTRSSPNPSKVTFAPPTNESMGKVQACLAQKIQALPLTTQRDLLKVPVTLLFLHSGTAEPLAADEDPSLALAQLEAINTQRVAAVAIRTGARQSTSNRYNALVDKYSANPNAVKVSQLKSSCQALLDADDALLATLQGALELHQRMQEFAQAQAAKGAQWQQAASNAQQQIVADRQEIENYKKARAGDAAACPKAR